MERIRAELVSLARQGRTTSYSELSQKFGIAVQGPWKPLLDEISQTEIRKGRPDITLLILNKAAGVPGQMKAQFRARPTPEARELIGDILEPIFEYYRYRQQRG